jgi:serine/threonine kinase 3
MEAVHLDGRLHWSFDPSVDSQSMFRQIEQVGCRVWKVVHIPSNTVFAGKLIDSSLFGLKSRKALEAEIEQLREVDSPYTVKYYGSVKCDGSILTLMEHCGRGSLRDVLDSREEPLTEDQISIVIHDLLKGLQLLQTRHRIAHRNIKASNILLSDASAIKISDFGVSRRSVASAATTMTIVGTPYWTAPEVITGLACSFPADIWSVGITAVELAEGAPPYAELTPPQAMVEIAVKGFPGYRYPDQHSQDFADFVRHCVEYDPTRRWTIAKLLDHPFVRRASQVPHTEFIAVLSDGALPANQYAGGNHKSLMLPHRPKVAAPAFGDPVRTAGRAPFANPRNPEQDAATVYHPPVGLDEGPGSLGVVNTIGEVRVAPIVVTVALIVAFGAYGVEGFVGAALVMVLAWLLFGAFRHRQRGAT